MNERMEKMIEDYNRIVEQMNNEITELKISLNDKRE
jgi:hypothetical protein